MRTGLAAVVAVLPIVVAGCGAEDGLGVVRISVSPWPGHPGPAIATSTPGAGTAVPLAEIAEAIPATLPENPPQGCVFGATVEIVLNDGQSLVYGPCTRPPSVERLRVALVEAAALAQPPPASPWGVRTPEWKAVLVDWYDGTLSHWHTCDAVREAIQHLPDSPPIYSTVFEDLSAYAEAVC